jgi:DNA polymerase-3 subunit alpha
MKTVEFVHLNVHSDFSLCNSTASVKALADRAEELGMKHLTLTDHGNMFGMMEFLDACEYTTDEHGRVLRKIPIHPIIGCEVYVTPMSRFKKEGGENENKYYHLILLAENRKGYLNLIKLCSLAYTEGFHYRPRVDNELLNQYSEGLIALSGCTRGEIPWLILEGKTEEAEQRACYYHDLFGENNFYLEIQDQGLPAEVLKGGLSQKDLNKKIADISRRTGIPLIATNNVHYIKREDAVAHDVLLCIGTGKQRSDENRKKFYGDQFYFKSGDEMAVLFPEYPEAIANTVKIAERCVADVPRVEHQDISQHLPEFEIPQGFTDANDYLRRTTFDGLAKRYPKEKEAENGRWDEIQKRLEYELDIIIKMHFSNYFLIVADYVNWAKDHDIPVGPGRSSCVGSVTAYALRITDIDPFKYDLLFERFINLERISLPDIDIDFGNEGLNEVIKYITEKYGRERVGQIITFGTLWAKAVIKDVARAIGISIAEAEKIAKLIPSFDFRITLKQAIDQEPELQDMGKDTKYAELFELAKKLEGLNRHNSLHAAGIVIGKSDLQDIVPIFKDAKTGGTATQYDWNHLEKCGLVQFDFLGLKTLDVIKHTARLIRGRGGEYANFNIDNIPEDDIATFTLFREGNTDNVFLFESEGIQYVLGEAKPETLTDLIALNALYRPGPMDNMQQFIESKNGKQKIIYPDPCLEDVLKETYGVIVYQEQIMRIIQRIAGYSLGAADLLRRTLWKKVKEIIEREKTPFLEGAAKQGYSADKARAIFDMLIPFAGYAFNKSHAAAYTKLAYQTAYLKANYLEEFKAAVTVKHIGV